MASKIMDIEKAVENYKEFLGILVPRIEEAVAKGDNVPTTIFAKEVCDKFGTEWSVIYNLMKWAVVSSDNLEVHLGPKGGVGLKKGMKIEDIVIE